MRTYAVVCLGVVVWGAWGCRSAGGDRGLAAGGAVASPSAEVDPRVTTARAPGDGPAVGVESVCAGLAESSRRVLRRLDEERASAKVDGAVGAEIGPGCLTEAGRRSGGAWALVAEDGVVTGPNELGAGSVSVKLALVWVGPDGSTRWQPLNDAEESGFAAHLGELSRTVRLERLHDFDRDGRPEVVLRTHSVQPDGPSDGRLDVHRVSASGVPERWDTGYFEALEDIDGDGVLDLVSPREFSAGRSDFDVQTPPNLPGVRRVLPGFKVSADDPAVKAFYKKRCPKKTKAADIRPTKDLPALAEQAACAWLWGEGGPAIDAAVARARPPVGPDELDGELLGPWSEEGRRPPVVLD